MNRLALAAAWAAAGVLTACKPAPDPSSAAKTAPVSSAASPAATAHGTASAPGAVPHGDHNPHHGGVVMMKGDLHYEVVFDPSGREYRLYFSDAVREDLPAAFASAVTLTVRRRAQTDESIVLNIDDTGESWIGSGRAVADPATTDVRVSFTVQGEPYWLDLPFAAGGDSTAPPK